VRAGPAGRARVARVGRAERVRRADARRRVLRILGCLGAFGSVAACGGLLAACSSGTAGAGLASTGATCGRTHTAAGVPVVIKVARGSVSCPTALGVENAYAARIRAGQVRGNGGGAPVMVSGWICQGFSTPEVLSTGDASRCRLGGTEILAVLAIAAGTQTPA
jgi:hypothetical protein